MDQCECALDANSDMDIQVTGNILVVPNGDKDLAVKRNAISTHSPETGKNSYFFFLLFIYEY